MPTSLLGIQIANGFSSEASVFAGLLAHTDPGLLNPHVLHHQWSGDLQSAVQFQRVSGAPLETLDFGWRSMALSRSLPAKVRARVQFFASLPKALTLARRTEPDVIYSSQQLWDCQAATYLARKLGKPQVIHLHYLIGPWLHAPVLNRLLTCDHVIAVSDFIREEALRHGVPADKVTTVRNAVSAAPPPDRQSRLAVRAELGLPPEAPVLGIVARLDPMKGQADTLTAFAEARRACPESRLLIIGEASPWHPEYPRTLQAQAEGLGVADAVHFLGRRADVPRLLNALDIFVHPARQEPFGLAMAEACSAGLPVLGYAEGGACEIVDHDVTGLLAPPGSTETLAAMMTALLSDTEAARKMGAAGRARMEAHFQPQESSRRFQAVINQSESRAGLES